MVEHLLQVCLYWHWCLCTGRDGWMDDLWFYVLLNSISVKLGRWEVDNERLYQWNSVYGWEDFALSRDRTWSARSVGQCLTLWATWAPCRGRAWTRSPSWKSAEPAQGKKWRYQTDENQCQWHPAGHQRNKQQQKKKKKKQQQKLGIVTCFKYLGEVVLYAGSKFEFSLTLLKKRQTKISADDLIF